ncbi:MAG: hypothetical protein ACR2KQ_01035 [Actinomycetota bacterium]
MFAGALYLARVEGAQSDPANATSWEVLLALLLFVLSYASIGALVVARQPRNPVGWLAAATGLMYSLASFLLLYSGLGLTKDPRPGGEFAFQMSAWMWLAGIVLGGPMLILFFPSGRLLSSRWRSVMAVLAVGLLAEVTYTSFSPGPLEPGASPNPVGIQGAEPVLDALSRVGAVLLILGSLLALVSVVLRYRSSTTIQRQQLKWFVFSLAVAAVVALPIGALLEALELYEVSNLLVTVALSIIPISIGIAILRHRILDIDVVINRALVYVALTAVLGLTYLSGVVVLQRLITPLTRDSDLAVAGSTLTVAGLFHPVRLRLQTFIDRSFYRRKYDAADTLKSFTERLRDQVDLDSLSHELVAVVDRTMQPRHTSLWLRTGVER